MKTKLQLVKREIAGDVILVPVGEATTQIKGLLTLNATGSAIWDILPQADSEEDIVDSLFEEFDADRETLECDVREFLDKLRDLNII